MIPADVASRLQVSSDAALRPVAPTQEISDKLAGLVAGQRVLAEIQALLPNGTYRALINQRNVTLSLPFSAKAGDSLELQVTETDGKLALAVLSRPESGEKQVTESATASLSRTGQLIGELYSNAQGAKGKATALPLNASQPIAMTPPESAEDLVPLLKQAIQQSGMFYESHQAEWVEGRLAKTDLLREPQGKLSSPEAFATADNHLAKLATESLTHPQATADSNTSPGRLPDSTASASATKPSSPGALVDTNERLPKTPSEPPARQANSPATDTTPVPRLDNIAGTTIADKSEGAQAPSQTSTSQPNTPQSSTSQTIAPQLQSLVQQQLEALATQNFSWQGQIWPGQEMRWEIDENAARNAQEEDDTATRWSTRLRLTLPRLGEIDARVQLHGNQLMVSMNTGDQATRGLMQASSEFLRGRMEAAGLTLTSIGVDTISREHSDGET